MFDDGVEDDLDLTDSINLATNSVDDREIQQGLLNGGSSDTCNPITSDNIRFRFVKGANAGTFLHEIFEKIDFTDNSKWSVIIDQSIRQYQLPISYASAMTQQRLQQKQAAPETDEGTNLTETNQLGATHDELMTWVADVLAAPLLASGQPLKAIPTRQRIAELSFNMGLSEDFTPEHINRVFKQYLPDEPETVSYTHLRAHET